MKVCPTCKRLYGSALGVCPGDGGILAALQEWRPGDSVSQNFRIIEKIGHGSIGAVFKAKLLPQGDLRVLKPLAAHLADHEFLIEYLRHKIEAASTLRHLNMVQIESLEWAADGRPFIVMEHAPGLSLRELLIREDPCQPGMWWTSRDKFARSLTVLTGSGSFIETSNQRTSSSARNKTGPPVSR